jgi:hypothetical protein
MATEAQCTGCGETNPADSAFCQFCNTYLGWDQEAPAAPEGRPSSPPAGGASASAPVGRTGEDPASPPPVAAASAESSQAAGQPTRGPEPAPTPAPTPTPAPQELRCPSCGNLNPLDRRFCARCGHALAPAPQPELRPTRAPAEGRHSWWGGDPQERAARRAYRRSLPPLYRWRRVLVALLACLLLAGVVWFLAGEPVRQVKDLWTSLTGDYETVQDVEASGSAAPTYSAGDVTDGDHFSAWAVDWSGSTTADSDCGTAPGERLTLSWQLPADIEEISIRAGLHDELTRRPNQFRPRHLDVEANGQCDRVELDDDGGWQHEQVDLDGEVTELTISVASAYENTADPVESFVAISEVRLHAR